MVSLYDTIVYPRVEEADMTMTNSRKAASSSSNGNHEMASSLLSTSTAQSDSSCEQPAVMEPELSSPNGKKSEETVPIVSNRKESNVPSAPPPSKMDDADAALDETENSFGGDVVGVFRSYLQGKETVEDTRRRIILSRTERHALNAERAKKAKEENVSLSKTNSKSNLGWSMIARSLLIDVPLALLMATFILAWLIRDVYTVYYEPLIQRARRSDDQLFDEFTYYERQCNQYDLSTQNVQDIVVDTSTSDSGSNDKDTIVPTAVHQMLQHGAVVIPSVLSPSTVSALRDYIVRKNHAISDAERYPMSQGHRRLSYGIDASEDTAVSAAIQEVAHHKVLRPLIATLLGDVDPASAEITSITAYDGAANQAWHQDTKQDGNALKFARTYSHSYSLFLPLQNITEQMGATDICPGTHYCANDITDMCEETKIGLHLVGENHEFPAGAGALLNQHVWHRGGAHTDPNAPERIVFILSFLARPDFEHDPRQLSRGTYFHQKWNMWGHTWTDLLAPHINMRPPFSLLRCLSLWKPRASHWGYDLITSGLMRFANEQLESDDFANRFLPRLDQIKFPHFLRGRHLQDTLQVTTWTIFIRETIHKVYNFAYHLNLWVHVAYFGIVVVVALWLSVSRRMGIIQSSDSRTRRSGLRLLRSATLRVTITHCVLLMVGFELWRTIRLSPWAQSITSGRALMRPFPPKDSSRATSNDIQHDNSPTTMPTRWDVLIGTRFDADFLGSYNNWLDYHPGNAEYKTLVANFASVFAAAKQLDSSLSQKVAMRVVDDVHGKDGRFLLQDHRTGDWRLLSAADAMETVSGDLVKASNPSLAAVSQAMARLIALYRFGPYRTTVMARVALGQLRHLQRQMLRTDMSDAPRLSPLSQTSPASPSISSSLQSWPQRRPGLLAKTLSRPTDQSFLGRAVTPSLKKRGPTTLKAGSLVWAVFDGLDEWFPGTVLSVVEPDRFDVSFDDNTREIVHARNITKFQPVTENDRADGCFEDGLDDCFPGTIRRVLPGGYVSIAFDDGTFSELVPPNRYFVPPFLYTGPHYA